MKYWIRLDQSALGPFTAAEIAQKYASQIRRETPCAEVGSNQWTTVGELMPEIISSGYVPPEQGAVPGTEPVPQGGFCDFPQTTFWTTLFYAIAVLQFFIGGIVSISFHSLLPIFYGVVGAIGSCFAAFSISLLVDIRWIQSEALNEMKRRRF